jgi:hypothetical protein
VTDHPDRQSLHRIEHCLQSGFLAFEEDRAEADQDEGLTFRRAGLDGSLDHARVPDVRR